MKAREPKTGIGKLVSGAFRKFKQWWELNKKPVVLEEARESTLEKLRRYKKNVEDENRTKIRKYSVKKRLRSIIIVRRNNELAL